MPIRRFRTELRLRKLHLIYDQLPESAQEQLYKAIRQLSQGQHPPRIWVGVPGEENSVEHS